MRVEKHIVLSCPVKKTWYMTSSYLYINQNRIHYHVWGRAGEQPALLFLHGLASNARIWEKVVPQLEQIGHPCYALDMRGHGLSDKPDSGYGFDEITRDTAAIIQSLQLERPWIIGHSWGASMAVDYASRVRMGPFAPAGIILVDGGMIEMKAIPGATWESTRQRLTPPQLAGMPVQDFVQRLQTWNSDWGPDEQAISIILSNFEISEDETISPRLSLDRHMQILAAMWEFPTFERFAQIHCPVLVIPARPKQPIPEEQQIFLAVKQQGIERLSQINPGAQVQWFEDTIHDIPLQRPEQLAEVIKAFVKKHQP